MSEAGTPAGPLRALVDELVRSGIRDVVICPGSRSTPMALALRADARLRCWVHLDERAGAFFALGAARASRRPTAILVTSGTAAAELMPALVEAHEGRVPLLALTADRPVELRDRGAPQAIDQDHLYGRFAKWYAELPVPEEGTAAETHVRGIVRRAVALAALAPAGPVHLNLPYREPLVPSGDLAGPSRVATGVAAARGSRRRPSRRRPGGGPGWPTRHRRHRAGGPRSAGRRGSPRSHRLRAAGRARLRGGCRGSRRCPGLPDHRGRARRRPLRDARPLGTSSPTPTPCCVCRPSSRATSPTWSCASAGRRPRRRSSAGSRRRHRPRSSSTMAAGTNRRCARSRWCRPSRCGSPTTWLGTWAGPGPACDGARTPDGWPHGGPPRRRLPTPRRPGWPRSKSPSRARSSTPSAPLCPTAASSSPATACRSATWRPSWARGSADIRCLAQPRCQRHRRACLHGPRHGRSRYRAGRRRRG